MGRPSRRRPLPLLGLTVVALTWWGLFALSPGADRWEEPEPVVDPHPDRDEGAHEPPGDGVQFGVSPVRDRR